MNTPDRPISAETLDELLSAELDGELTRAAPELGFTSDEALAAIAAAPNAAARRAELARARDLLAVHPAADPTRELRMVGAAVDRAGYARLTARRPSDRRRLDTAWRAIAGVAAAAAVIAGVVVLANSHASSDSKASSAVSAVSPAVLPRAAAPLHKAASSPRLSIAFGDVSSPNVLLERVRRALPSVASAPLPQYSADSGRTANGVSSTTSSLDTPLQQFIVVGPRGPAGATGPTGTEGAVAKSRVPVAQHGVKGPAGPAGLSSPAGRQGLLGEGGVLGGVGAGAPADQTPLLGAGGPQAATGPEGPTAAQGGVKSIRPTGAIGGTGGAAASGTQAACIADLQQDTGLRSAPVIAGFGSQHGKPAFVVVLPQPGSYAVFVLAHNCAVVVRETLP